MPMLAVEDRKEPDEPVKENPFRDAMVAAIRRRYVKEPVDAEGEDMKARSSTIASFHAAIAVARAKRNRSEGPSPEPPPPHLLRTPEPEPAPTTEMPTPPWCYYAKTYHNAEGSCEGQGARWITMNSRSSPKHRFTCQSCGDWIVESQLGVSTSR